MKFESLDDIRRTAVINAAMEEFVNRGYDHASTNSMAKRAGMSKPLMFHYITSKEELFLYLLNYCVVQLKQGYRNKMDYDERDIFSRLIQSYSLQLELLREHPWLLGFSEVYFNQEAKTSSDKINQKIVVLTKKNAVICLDDLFKNIDDSHFQNNLTIKRNKELIYFAASGFANQAIEEIKRKELSKEDFRKLETQVSRFFDDLRSVFYGTSK